jgi:hypothetical protein
MNESDLLTMQLNYTAKLTERDSQIQRLQGEISELKNKMNYIRRGIEEAKIAMDKYGTLTEAEVLRTRQFLQGVLSD